jgi:hypothetical protein
MKTVDFTRRGIAHELGIEVEKLKTRFWWARLPLRTRALNLCWLLEQEKMIPTRSAFMALVKEGTVSKFPTYGDGTLDEILAGLGYVRVRRRCRTCGVAVSKGSGEQTYDLTRIKGKKR